eukprot:4374829-Prymnesium_polylepis.1
MLTLAPNEVSAVSKRREKPSKLDRSPAHFRHGSTDCSLVCICSTAASLAISFASSTCGRKELRLLTK